MKTKFATPGIRAIAVTAALISVAVANAQTAQQGSRALGVIEIPDMTRLSLQPLAGAGAITLRDHSGHAIGAIRDFTVFDIEVPRATIAKATTARGVNQSAILQALKKKRGSSGDLIEATLPFETMKTDGSSLEPGSRIYLSAKELSIGGRLRVSGAQSGERHSEAFNKTLFEKGIVDDRVNTRGAHTHPQVPLSEGNQPSSPEGGRLLLSSPTCGCAKGSCYTTSYFGKRASSRTTNGRRMSTNHQGLDIGGGAGTPIIAAADGCVTRKLTYRSGGYGLSLYLDHGNGYVTQYSHMRDFEADAHVGRCFKRGEPIGRMGQTGNCTGPHLHFGVFKDGRAVDPRGHLAARDNNALSLSCSAHRPTPGPVVASTNSNETPDPRANAWAIRGAASRAD